MVTLQVDNKDSFRKKNVRDILVECFKFMLKNKELCILYRTKYKTLYLNYGLEDIYDIIERYEKLYKEIKKFNEKNKFIFDCENKQEFEDITSFMRILKFSYKCLIYKN